jgi:glycosyltransferase involved in cell wall biosynthesis
MIVIDASPAVHRKAGLARYAEELTGALAYADPQVSPVRSGYAAFYHDATHAKPSALIQSLPRIAVAQTPYRWRLRALLAQLANISQDALLAGIPEARVFHATEHLLPRFKKVRTVFTLHDLIFRQFPQHHLPRNRIFLNVAMPLFLRRADAVICVSEHTRRDAISAYGIPEEKMIVIHEGVHPRFRRIDDEAAHQAVREIYALPERFVLSVGTIEPRKNYPLLIEAFAELMRRQNDATSQLIIVGREGWLFEETYRAVHSSGMTGRVRFVGYIDDAHLPVLYSMADIFALSSVYEGFGFPPLEALACGAAVVCSNASSLPEIVGDAALLLPPTNARAWADALERVWTDAALRRDLRSRGPAWAARFTWQAAAQATRRVYDELLGESSNSARR